MEGGSAIHESITGKELEWTKEEEMRYRKDEESQLRKVAVPNNEATKAEIMKIYHDSPIAGHPGIAKTIEIVERDHYWPGMREWITEYVKTCEVCQRSKVPRGKTKPPLQPLEVPEGPWTHITADFVTGLPITERGYNAVLTIVDRFTKWATFVPCTDEVNSEATARLFVDNIYTMFGMPTKITTDRGPQFSSKFMTADYEMLGITPALSTAYHPQTDGQSERVNQELEQYLRCYVDYQQDDWDKYLKLAQFAHNNRRHSATGESPFYLNFGRHPRVEFAPKQSDTEKATDYTEQLKKIHENAREALEKAREQMKHYEDKHRGQEPDLKVGDRVLLRAENINLLVPTRKLAMRNLGPYEIVEKLGPLNYRLKLPAGLKVYSVFYAGLLKKYETKEYPGRKMETRPAPIIIGDELHFEVDKILDCQRNGNKYRYKIRWTGYTAADDTWEPLGDDIKGAAELIKEFHEKHPKAPKPPKLDEWLERHLPKPGPKAKRLTRQRREIIIRDFAYPEEDSRHSKPRRQPDHRPDGYRVIRPTSHALGRHRKKTTEWSAKYKSEIPGYADYMEVD